ncbi:Hypothetical predicted protein [Pelobates cultripes]|uniref:Uncharacterized protein n=1 Tax=Pelobates cultripes TaxID=61616 RepID=A0AAD1W575_PELCU|nr:Hypothetical predicted protein [Pelobates cultripes]
MNTQTTRWPKDLAILTAFSGRICGSSPWTCRTAWSCHLYHAIHVREAPPHRRNLQRTKTQTCGKSCKTYTSEMILQHCSSHLETTFQDKLALLMTEISQTGRRVADLEEDREGIQQQNANGRIDPNGYKFETHSHDETARRHR